MVMNGHYTHSIISLLTYFPSGSASKPGRASDVIVKNKLGTRQHCTETLRPKSTENLSLECQILSQKCLETVCDE